ncbi:MAG: SRPBCC domain-containing protein [Actinobacteria bacterium]|nr:SRPBCC domain-containing protein [Actinomycetota bacterium]
METEIRREIVLPAPPDEVWEALTDPERLAEWFANEVELDLRPGGEGIFRWDDGSERRAVVEVAEGPRRFTFDWGGEDEQEATRVDFTLEETAEGTRLTVVESSPAGLRACAGEWTWALELVAHTPARA